MSRDKTLEVKLQEVLERESLELVEAKTRLSERILRLVVNERNSNINTYSLPLKDTIGRTLSKKIGYTMQSSSLKLP